MGIKSFRRKLAALVIPGLAAKSVAFAISWFFLPNWVAPAVGLFFYLFPVFRVFEMAAPFAITAFLAFTTEKSPLFAIFLAVVFYLLLALKDMRFVDKEHPQDILSFSLLSGLFISFFSFFNGWDSFAPVILSLLISFAAFFLLKAQISRRFIAKSGSDVGLVSAAIAALMLWQLTLLMIFLPLNFVYQSAIALVFAVIVFGIVADYSSDIISKRRILVNFSAFLFFSAVILGSAQWGL